jgi:excisionase family DNA binding protein
MTIKLLTTEQVAELLHKKPGTLRLWRVEQKGPRFRKIGHHVRYTEEDVRAYLDSTARTHTHQQPPAATQASA